jgi:GT2 family glycosyltransferase
VKILAAVVTHNREKLLERCIDHLKKQTRPPDDIVVINNGSTDGTLAMVKRKKVRAVTQDNLGSAGGWRRSIDEALNVDADAVWLMDDDGYPDARALEVLERNFSDGTACLSSIVVDEKNHDRLVFPLPVLDRKGQPVLFATQRKIRRVSELLKRGSVSYPFAHLFNGALVSLETVRRIGNVDDRFFLMGDEIDYLMRMRADGQVATHLEALHFHPNVASRPWSDVKVYYYLKNSIILNKRYFSAPLIRDAAALVAAVGRVVKRNSLSEGLSYVAGSRAPLLWRAVARGFRGRPAKDFHG